MIKRSLICVFGAILVTGCWYPSLSSGQQLLSTHEADTVEGQPESIHVPFATLRNKTGNSELSDYFGGSRGALGTGVCSVTFSPIWRVGEIAESVPFYVPDEKIELTGIKEVPLTNFSEDLAAYSNQDNANLVLYIHGYNIDFEKSCRRAALFQRELGLQDRLLLFSWPADGNMLKYTWDEADLVWSVPHIATYLEHLVSLTGGGRIDVVAHSLGARGVVQALVRLYYRYGDEQMINELILIAPDIDTDVFHQELENLGNIVGRITIYVSENDRALRLSEEVHGHPRLGQAGESLTLFKGVEIIDLSHLSNRRLSGHLYHLFNPEVIDDLTELLHTGKRADQRSQLERIEKNNLPYWRLLPKDSS